MWDTRVFNTHQNFIHSHHLASQHIKNKKHKDIACIYQLWHTKTTNRIDSLANINIYREQQHTHGEWEREKWTKNIFFYPNIGSITTTTTKNRKYSTREKAWLSKRKYHNKMGMHVWNVAESERKTRVEFTPISYEQTHIYNIHICVVWCGVVWWAKTKF